MPPRRKHSLSKEEFVEWFNNQLEVQKDGCRTWSRAKTLKGYGSCWTIDGRLGRAHRVALELKLGRPLADGMHALHSCDNPPCCNPDHLREGTNVENMKERQDKERQSKGEQRSLLFRGEKHNGAKLTETTVREILSQKGSMAIKALSIQYSVSIGAISGVLYGTTWKHIPREN